MVQADLLEERGVDLVLKPARARARASQRVLIYPARNTASRVAGAVGESYEVEYVIIGNAEFQVGVGDRFTFPAGVDGGRNGEVVYVEDAYQGALGQRQARAKVVA